MSRRCHGPHSALTLAACLVAACAGSSAAMPAGAAAAYDSAPIDWAYYEKLWIKDFPTARADEPRLHGYDALKAAAFLDDIALRFTRQNECATCHTNVAYLMARPLIHGGAGTEEEVRTLLLATADRQIASPTPYLPVFLAPIVSAVVVHDARSGAAVDTHVLQIFDRLWSLQDADGGWHYPTENFLPLMERDNRYLALLVELAIGYAPSAYRDSDAARAGIPKLAAFIRKHLPENDHDRAVLLWASVRTPGLLSPPEQHAVQARLLRRQNRDGGWTLTALGTWPRHDGPPNDPHGPSDGYATALAALALCESGYGHSKPPIRAAMQWLETHQRVSGRWFTPSTYSSRFRNYLSNMATGYAIMAIGSCGLAHTH